LSSAPKAKPARRAGDLEVEKILADVDAYKRLGDRADEWSDT
jgi:hypothetical protein